MDLSQEDKDRIEAEERHRADVREKLERQGKKSGPQAIGCLAVLLLIVVVAVVEFCGSKSPLVGRTFRTSQSVPACATRDDFNRFWNANDADDKATMSAMRAANQFWWIMENRTLEVLDADGLAVRVRMVDGPGVAYTIPHSEAWLRPGVIDTMQDITPSKK